MAGRADPADHGGSRGSLARYLHRRRDEKIVLSPLRYPGAKRRLLPYIIGFLKKHELRPDLFFEPFAGGAGVSLQLLADDLVQAIGLADADPLVTAFWKTVFSDADWLIEQVQTTSVTVKNWRHFNSVRPRSRRDRALKLLYLNRTSFSGIVGCGAGPIGGWKQTSPNKIDCRFPRETLVRRIEQAWGLRDRVAFVWEMDWQDSLRRVRMMRSAESVFVYLDPPFFAKADSLYEHHFLPADHRRLRNSLTRLNIPWLLSYDSAPELGSLYGGRGMFLSIDRVYTVSNADHRHAVPETMITNLRSGKRKRLATQLADGHRQRGACA